MSRISSASSPHKTAPRRSRRRARSSCCSPRSVSPPHFSTTTNIIRSYHFRLPYGTSCSAKADLIQIQLTKDSAQASPLFGAIPLRQNTRSDYDGQPVPAADLDRLEAMLLEPGVALRFVLNSADKAIVSEYVSQGNLAQYADAAFVEELTAWLRFNKKEALASLDGLYTRSSGNPEMPRCSGSCLWLEPSRSSRPTPISKNYKVPPAPSWWPRNQMTR